MTAANRSFPQTARAAAEFYLPMGLAPVPDKGKQPWDVATMRLLSDWQMLRLDASQLDDYFPDGYGLNIGILNGGPSGNQADADLDCPEAIRAAPYLLPGTGWIFGRATAPRSHWIYRTDRPSPAARIPYEDLDGTKLVELLGGGSQTVFPPSIWQDKEPPHRTEPVAWDTFTERADVELSALERAVAELAAAAILARHWPARGNRDNAALALAGGLTRAGWSEERVALFCRAVAVAAGDEEAPARGKKAKPTARKQEAGKNTTGWPRLAALLKGDGGEVVLRVRDWLGLTDKAAPEILLTATPPWPAPLGQEALYGLAGDVVRALEPESEADPVALLVQFLVAFGNVVGRSHKAVVEGTDHHPNLFAVLVGATSKARKGSSWARIRALFEAAEPKWAGRRVASGLSSGEGLIWHVRDPIMAREKVKQKGQPSTTTEYEADPGEEDKRLLVVEPEWAVVLRQIERQGNTLSAVLRLAWESGTLRTLTKNSPARATGAHISLLGHITADELRRYLSTTEAASGFGNRFLWLCVKRSKCLPDGGKPVDLTPFVDRLQQAIAHARGAWVGMCTGLGVLGPDTDPDELIDPVTGVRQQTPAWEMVRDAGAQQIWREVYPVLSEAGPGLSGSMTARAEAQALRLSCVYALLDLSDKVRAEHLMAALALVQYVEESVRHVFGDSLGDPVADELLRLLRGCPNGMTRTEIRDYFQRNASADRIGRALGLLLQNHLARREQEQTGGRPSERWYAGSTAKG
jgi:hypothetical protein